MSQVRVRMYRPGGIGDCILLSFQDGQGPHMLIDCGILKGTPGGAENLKKVVRNVAEVTGGKLDVLVVTHEHWDHVSGFLMAAEEFEKLLPVGEVWLAWTEERGNDLADRLRTQKEKAKRAVGGASARLRGLMGSDAQAGESLAVLEKLALFYADDPQPGLPAAPSTSSSPEELPAFSTARAMDWARAKTGGRVRYLAPGKEPLTLRGVEGARIFVLGPPQDEQQIKKDNPSKKNPEVYSLASGNNMGFMAALEVMKPQSSESDGRPFHPTFECTPKKAGNAVFFQQTYFSEAEAWRKIEMDWLWAAARLALQLDSDTNNTSLALAIELTGSHKVLLFPGDAQVGNWLSWQGLEWTVRNARGELEKVTAESLLERTALYKVGHHASHNATLRWGLELMAGEDLVAIIPVYEAQARDQGKKGWDMPFPPLLQRLKEKTGGRIFRADQGVPDGWEAKVDGKYDVQEGWIDVWVGY